MVVVVVVVAAAAAAAAEGGDVWRGSPDTRFMKFRYCSLHLMKQMVKGLPQLTMERTVVQWCGGPGIVRRCLVMVCVNKQPFTRGAGAPLHAHREGLGLLASS